MYMIARFMFFYKPGVTTAAVEREAAAQPRENRNLEDGEQGLLVPLEAHSKEGSPRE